MTAFTIIIIIIIIIIVVTASAQNKQSQNFNVQRPRDFFLSFPDLLRLATICGKIRAGLVRK